MSVHQDTQTDVRCDFALTEREKSRFSQELIS